MRPVQLQPEDAKPGNTVPAHMVRDWPEMTAKSAVAFRQWTGKRLRPDHRLVRKTDRIFEVGPGDVAWCVWMTDRQF